MRITLAGVFVDDQDKALAFYTEALGFTVHTDVPMGESERWLTVVSPEQPQGTQLLLEPADDAARAFQQTQRSASKPAIAFSTDDCQREYKRLVANGVIFTLEPTVMPYGGTDAVFDDTCGNLICLHQD